MERKKRALLRFQAVVLHTNCIIAVRSRRWNVHVELIKSGGYQARELDSRRYSPDLNYWLDSKGSRLYRGPGDDRRRNRPESVCVNGDELPWLRGGSQAWIKTRRSQNAAVQMRPHHIRAALEYEQRRRVLPRLGRENRAGGSIGCDDYLDRSRRKIGRR